MHKQAMDVSLAVSRAGVVYLLEVGSFTNCEMIHTVQKIFIISLASSSERSASIKLGDNFKSVY